MKRGDLDVRNWQSDKSAVKPITVIIGILIVISLLIGETAWSDVFEMFNTRPTLSELLESENIAAQVHILDVGQADSIIVISGEEVMLVDAGEADTADYVARYIQSLGINTFDKVVATHPHTDHIGGMTQILRKYETDEIIMPYAISETRTYERLLDAVAELNLKVTEPTPGDVIPFGEGELLMLSPDPMIQWEELNNESISFIMSVAGVRMLFTGDMERESELAVLDMGFDIDCDLMKVAHHGSKSSSCNDFLDAVTPSHAFITCEVNSKNNLPAESVIEKYEERGCKVYRTDTSGNIVISIYRDSTFDISCAADK